MTNTLSSYYAQLLTYPEIRELIQAHFEEEASKVLQGMEHGSLSRDQAEDLEALISTFMDDHAEEVACFQGLATTSTSSQEAIGYFKVHHPEAHDLIQAQAKELERLLGKDGAAMALGQKREPFYINILCWNDLYMVTAEEFDDEWFNNKEMAIAAAQRNYEPFIQNFSRQEKLANKR